MTISSVTSRLLVSVYTANVPMSKKSSFEPVGKRFSVYTFSPSISVFLFLPVLAFSQSFQSWRAFAGPLLLASDHIKLNCLEAAVSDP